MFGTADSTKLSRLRRLSVNLPAITIVVIAGIFAFLDLTGWQLTPVVSSSMRPTLRVGDAAFVREIRSADVSIGDVIVYRAPTEGRPLVIHRVINVQKTTTGVVVKTKGDANPVPDVWTTKLGPHVNRRVATIRGGGALISDAKDLGIAYVLVFGTVVLMVGFTLRVIWHQPRFTP